MYMINFVCLLGYAFVPPSSVSVLISVSIACTKTQFYQCY